MTGPDSYFFVMFFIIKNTIVFLSLENLVYIEKYFYRMEYAQFRVLRD